MELFGLVHSSAVWLEKREDLLLPCYSLISEFAWCDNGVCVCSPPSVCSEEQDRSQRQEAKCWRRLSALPVPQGVHARRGQK